MGSACIRGIILVEVGVLEFRNELHMKLLENVLGDHVKLKTEARDNFIYIL